MNKINIKYLAAFGAILAGMGGRPPQEHRHSPWRRK